ncbi:uncharacterized protein FPRN_03305 [Fusarium proliferatum]|nr:uncharacterized protein FPRN_03305 [Fusarium proliferatum]
MVSLSQLTISSHQRTTLAVPYLKPTISSIFNPPSKMCNWNIYLWKCNCWTLAIKEPCHFRRQQKTANCNQIQQVKKEWVHVQDKPCVNHRANASLYVNGPTAKWEDIESTAYQSAKSLAERGEFPDFVE